MDTTTTTEPAGKRARNSSVILTDRMCEKRVAKRVKIYDRKCPGLYVSITTAGVATFSFKFTDPATGKQRTGWLGVYNPETFAVEDARSKVYGLRGTGAAALAETFRDQKVQQAKRGKTVDEIIEERIEWMKTPVKQAGRRNAAPARKLGEHRQPSAAFRQPSAWQEARRAKSPSTTLRRFRTTSSQASSACPRSAMRGTCASAVSGLFNWAAEAGRDYVTASPCVNLPKLDPEHPRTRVLSEEEIRIFWHGLDRDDLPWDRKTRLALKFELVTMLRSGELLAAHRDELFDLDGDNPRFDVPLKRVKKRRVIQQPLSDLAVEIIREALEDDKELRFRQPAWRSADEPEGHGNRPARHEAQGQGEDARHLRAARPEAVHAARSAPDGGDPGR